MTSAYNSMWLYNLAVVKETKRWFKHGLIRAEQLTSIREVYPSGFYHPNFIIRILLFVATILALSGITGLFGLMIADSGEKLMLTGCIVYGILSFFVLDIIFISTQKHYKSGVTEALLYHACGFVIVGVAWMGDFDNIFLTLFVCFIVFSFAGFRYLDLLTTLAALICFGGLIFYELALAGEIYKQTIPFVFIAIFTPIYFACRKLKTVPGYSIWINNLIVMEAFCLIVVYAAGNYLVVRELSVSMMNLDLSQGDDIPFAFLFYAFTVSIPLAYLFFGIKEKDVVLLRVSLLALAFSVFTFKYYYGFGHPEISLTVAGIVLTGIALILMNYLKIMRNGYTRENLLTEKWGSANIQAMLISQTMGGNEVTTVDNDFKGGGGEFGGGGASGEY
jgi:uncharacterized membrane protein YgcG